MPGSLVPLTLSTWPTPVEPMPRLAAALGLGREDLLVKRDDLTGIAGGGNKIRKLEWTVAEALADDADTLVTTGGPQSNHARLTAAAAARLGLRAVLVFPGEPPAARSGNLVLDALLGAEIVFTGVQGQQALTDAAAGVCERLRSEGARPALIPFGGSSMLATRGYATCGEELMAQVPDLRTAVVALGSGATMAGLVASLGPDRTLGVDVGAVEDSRERVAAFAAALSPEVRADDLRVDRDHIGNGYASLTDTVQEALTLVARLEGIILDPTYTGRAMAGLIAATRRGEIAPGDRTVFVHTGGLPGMFGHPDVPAFAERVQKLA
ncbi:pyridoxal-phosphate dependent enzyme [Micromonospora sp. RHAY321]|uniref:pyridoxal-phosphate dependent enzyme n=1 Tax=Micromonospora sp. RHAY321 TaxID=2944807 RepID=UPI00207D2E31|nr:pyridoxal-phosphate dependent enzyme [Micromonospora sp. RHAY321]MCO1594445.1 pyridoxal-phosphate dependent enzyme [Micromonospora sp. RHAY321]